MDFSKCQCQIGDLIEIKRSSAYSHWGVIVGKGQIIHLTCNTSSRDNIGMTIKRFLTKTVVRCDKLDDVAGTCEVFVNNSLDSQLKAKVKEEILGFAENCLGKEGYGILFGNCETLANMCRYGIPVSFQAVNVLQILVALKAGVEVGKLTKRYLQNKIGVLGATICGGITGFATLCLTITVELVKEFITSAVIEASKYVLLNVGLAAASNVAFILYLFYMVYEVVTSEAFKTIFGWLLEKFVEFLSGLYNLVVRAVSRLGFSTIST